MHKVEFDKVIVTVPSAVLKTDQIKFDPPLPQSYKSSISKLGSGLLDKLVLKFNHVFWDSDVDWFNYVAEAPHFYDWT